MAVLDYAVHPAADVYDLLTRTVEIGNRVLVIQTVSARSQTWRDFLEARWPGGRVAEIVPVDDCPAVSGRLRFRHDHRPDRDVCSVPAACPRAEWETPWGPATQVTRIAAGIEFFETETSSCYRLTPARNAEVPKEWREIVSRGEEGWYAAADDAIVMLTFRAYFGGNELAGARQAFKTVFEPRIAARPGR
jgi:hypothetical protein